jgi:hypothetical protein
MRPLKDYFSISSVTAKLLLLLKRFPISVLLVAATEFYNEAVILERIKFLDRSDDLLCRSYLFITLGVFISVTAALWSEDIVDYVKQYAITAAVIALWGVYCFFIPIQNVTLIPEITTIGLAASLSIYFISFLKKDTDKAFWNFAMRVTFQYLLAICFGVIILIGLCGAFYAVGALFNVEIPENVYAHLASICLVLFTHLCFLANIPDKSAKHDNDIRLSKSMKALGLYVLMPLVVIYAVILYVYLFKIIIAWELPKGLVSWLVSSLACVGFLTVGILYPARLEEKNKAAVYMSRYFGLALLPLLALMTVGIFRRVYDYGITVFRGYLIVANIWLCGVCVYHFITKARRIKWILISFTVVALLSSFHFCGVMDVTKHILTAEIRGYVGNQKISIADINLSDSALFDKIGQENRKKVAQKIKYLRKTFGFESVQAFFERDATERNVLRFEKLWEETAPESNDNEDEDFFSNEWHNRLLDIKGYNKFAYVEYKNRQDDEKVRSSFNSNQLTIVCGAGSNKRTFNIPLIEEIRPLVNNPNKEIYLKTDEYLFLINTLGGYYYHSADSVALKRLEGYLFYNE